MGEAMKEFTASNGVSITIETTNAGTYLVGKKDREVPTRGVYADTHAMGSVDGIAALREFFRAEEDERLGRWRDPERDSFVVYPQRSAGIIVLCEMTGTSRLFANRNDVDSFRSSYLSPSAYAYFDAHPEPKPAWHDAKEGEVWIITYKGEEYPAIFQAGMFRDHGGAWDADRITAGRRIYPEATE